MKQAQQPTKHPAMDSFERGFSSCSAGAVRQCKCGRMFFNPNGGWDWENGELESLEAAEKEGRATGLDWAVGTVIFDGAEYVIDCDCWRARAVKVIRWIVAHDESIAQFLTFEKRRKAAEAERSPVVQGSHP